MVDPTQLADIVAQAIETATAPLVARIAQLERQKSIQPMRGDPGPAGERGQDAEPPNFVINDAGELVAMAGNQIKTLGLVRGQNGQPGKDADVEQIAMRVKELIPVVPGPAGPKGDRGERGEKGLDGVAGRDGVGMPGPAGERGPQGEKGLDGRDGVGLPGAIGERGPQGEKGIDGRDGTSFDVDAFTDQLTGLIAQKSMAIREEAVTVRVPKTTTKRVKYERMDGVMRPVAIEEHG